MAKANQRAQWERGTGKSEPPSERTSKISKYSKKPHNHFPQGKTGFDPKLARLRGNKPWQ